MNYNEMFNDESNVTNVTNVSIDEVKLTSDNNTIVGKLINIEQFVNKKYSKEPQAKYVFETDKNKISWIPPKRFVIDYGQHMKIGNILKITYKCDKQLSGNRKMKIFDVLVILKTELHKQDDGSVKHEETSEQKKTGMFGKR